MTTRSMGALALCAVLLGCGGSATQDAQPSDAGDTDASATSDSSDSTDTTTDAAAPACKVTVPTACTQPGLRFADVEPIITKRCSSTCHAAGNPDGNWPLTSYQHVADWNMEIRDAVSTCMMPPPVANVPITVAEREKILVWLRCGYPH